MNFHFNRKKYHPSKFIRIIQIFLLILIIIGIGLLLTQNIWVPKLVDFILKNNY